MNNLEDEKFKIDKNFFRDALWGVLGSGSGIQFGESREEVFQNWSPNNVRRLIISPDFFGVVKFTHSRKESNAGSTIVKSLEPKVYAVLENDEKFISMFKKEFASVLRIGYSSSGRAFSNLEDVILITSSERGVEYSFNMQMLRELLNLLALLPENQKRFRGVFVNLSTDFKTSAKEDDFGTRGVLESTDNLNLLDECQGSLTDYRRFYSLRPNYYYLDRKMSELHTYFKNDFDEYKKSERLKGREVKKEEIIEDIAVVEKELIKPTEVQKSIEVEKKDIIDSFHPILSKVLASLSNKTIGDVLLVSNAGIMNSDEDFYTYYVDKVLSNLEAYYSKHSLSLIKATYSDFKNGKRDLIPAYTSSSMRVSYRSIEDKLVEFKVIEEGIDYLKEFNEFVTAVGKVLERFYVREVK